MRAGKLGNIRAGKPRPDEWKRCDESIGLRKALGQMEERRTRSVCKFLTLTCFFVIILTQFVKVPRACCGVGLWCFVSDLKKQLKTSKCGFFRFLLVFF